VALSDPGGILASPFTIISSGDGAANIAAVVDIVRQQAVGRIIVGLPRSMNGSLGRQAEKVEAFAQKLREYTEMPVEFRDERLSTVAARRLMRAAGGKKSKQRARHDDAIAAALILQGYLDEASVQ